MALLDRLSRLFTRKQAAVFNQRFAQLYSSTPSFLDEDLIEYVEKGYSYNAAVYSVVKLITSNFSRVKWGAYNADGDLLPDHELTKLLKRPNPLQGQSEFFEMLLGYKLITGNSYIHSMSPDAGINKGKPKQLQLLPAQHVDIYSDVFGYPKKYVVDVGVNPEYPAEQVLHLRFANYEWDIDGRQNYGMSPIKAAARITQVNNDGVTSLAKAFQNQGAVGIFSFDGDVELNEEQIQQLEERYRTKYQGADKNGTPMWVGNNLIWTKLGVDPVDLAIIESQKWSVAQICNVFKVPAVLIMNESSTYNNMKEAREALWEENLIPELKQVKDQLNNYFGQYFPDVQIDFDLSDIGVLQENEREKVDYLKTADFLTINEKRELMGYEPIADGDTLLIPANLLPIGESILDPTKSTGEYQVKATYNDYPQGATNNAKRALKYKEENGSDCGTPVGWARANQLANREPLSVETIKRTFSFLSRAETYYTDGGSLEECGNIMYLAWGGKSMKQWCESKLNELEE